MVDEKLEFKQYVKSETSIDMDLNEYGVWGIYGIDNERIETLEGVFGDILDYVCDDNYDGYIDYETKEFGSILKEVSPIKITGDTLRKKKELEEKKKYLENEIDKINSMLCDLLQ